MNVFANIFILSFSYAGNDRFGMLRIEFGVKSDIDGTKKAAL